MLEEIQAEPSLDELAVKKFYSDLADHKTSLLAALHNRKLQIKKRFDEEMQRIEKKEQEIKDLEFIERSEGESWKC